MCWLAGCHVTEGASACAHVTHNHHRGMAFFPALADIWARRLLADRVKAVRAERSARLIEDLSTGRLHADPRGLGYDWGIGQTRLFGMARLHFCLTCIVDERDHDRIRVNALSPSWLSV